LKYQPNNIILFYYLYRLNKKKKKKKKKKKNKNKNKNKNIGDSITCASGVDGNEKDIYFKTIQNGAKLYIYLTTKNFDANYSTVYHNNIAILSCVSYNNERSPLLFPINGF